MSDELLILTWYKPGLLEGLEAEGRLEEYIDIARRTVTLVHPTLKGNPTWEEAAERVLVGFYKYPKDFLVSVIDYKLQSTLH